jgi:hypothetical protein
MAKNRSEINSGRVKMDESSWIAAGIAGGILLCGFACLWSSLLYQRSSADYRKHLKREEERQNRDLSLLTKQEQLLERIEALVGKLESRFGIMLPAETESKITRRM